MQIWTGGSDRKRRNEKTDGGHAGLRMELRPVQQKCNLRDVCGSINQKNGGVTGYGLVTPFLMLPHGFVITDLAQEITTVFV